MSTETQLDYIEKRVKTLNDEQGEMNKRQGEMSRRLRKLEIAVARFTACFKAEMSWQKKILVIILVAIIGTALKVWFLG